MPRIVGPEGQYGSSRCRAGAARPARAQTRSMGPARPDPDPHRRSRTPASELARARRGARAAILCRAHRFGTEIDARTAQPALGEGRRGRGECGVAPEVRRAVADRKELRMALPAPSPPEAALSAAAGREAPNDLVAVGLSGLQSDRSELRAIG